MSWKKTIFLSSLTGVLVALSYIPFYPWAFAFFLVPLFYSWWKNHTSIAKILASSLLSSFFMNLIGFYWIPSTFSSFHNISLIQTTTLFLAYSFFANYFILIAGFFGWLINKRTRNPHAKMFNFIVIFAICEQIFEKLIPWNFGYIFLYGNFPLYNFADFIGFSGLSSLVIIANGLAIIPLVYNMRSKILYYCVLLTGFLILNFAGTKRQNYLLSKTDQKSIALNTLIIQPNVVKEVIPPTPNGYQKITEQLLSLINLTDEIIRENSLKPELIVWPEAAFHLYVDQKGEMLNDEGQERLVEYLNTHNFSLASGVDLHSSDSTLSKNSAIFYDRDTKTISIYSKNILFPFGEYLPGRDLLAKYFKNIDIVPSRGANEVTVLRDEKSRIRIAPIICFESIFSDFLKGFSEFNLIINFTNDLHFGNTSESIQNYYMSIARAFEHRHPFIRAANSGISTIQDGIRLQEFSTSYGERTFLYKEIKLYENKTGTFYSKMPVNITLIFLFIILGTHLIFLKKD